MYKLILLKLCLKKKVNRIKIGIVSQTQTKIVAVLFVCVAAELHYLLKSYQMVYYLF